VSCSPRASSFFSCEFRSSFSGSTRLWSTVFAGESPIAPILPVFLVVFDDGRAFLVSSSQGIYQRHAPVLLTMARGVWELRESFRPKGAGRRGKNMFGEFYDFERVSKKRFVICCDSSGTSGIARKRWRRWQRRQKDERLSWPKQR